MLETTIQATSGTSQIDRSNVEDLQNGQTLYSTTHKNADGTPLRVRVSGKLKLWVTRPEHFRIPVKYGLRTSFYITQDNAYQFTTDSN